VQLLTYFKDYKTMKKLIALAAVAVVAMAPALAKANEEVKVEAAVEAPAADATVAVEAKEATLKDGTKISIEGDKVFVVAADGAKTPAPDGEHELADGTKVTTSAGAIVK